MNSWRDIMRALGFDPEPLGRAAYAVSVLGDTTDTEPLLGVTYDEQTGEKRMSVVPWWLALEVD